MLCDPSNTSLAESLQLNRTRAINISIRPRPFLPKCLTDGN